MKNAKCYGMWGIPYYRTEDGDTYSVAIRPNGMRMVFYWGNVLLGEPYKQPKILTEEEAQEINFIN